MSDIYLPLVTPTDLTTESSKANQWSISMLLALQLQQLKTASEVAEHFH